MCCPPCLRVGSGAEPLSILSHCMELNLAKSSVKDVDAFNKQKAPTRYPVAPLRRRSASACPASPISVDECCGPQQYLSLSRRPPGSRPRECLCRLACRKAKSRFRRWRYRRSVDPSGLALERYPNWRKIRCNSSVRQYPSTRWCDQWANDKMKKASYSVSGNPTRLVFLTLDSSARFRTSI